MKHVKKLTATLPAKASAKGEAKSCGPIKDALGLCTEDDGIFE